MGFFDKAKENIERVAKQGQEKLDEVQAKKKADGLLRDLGAWTYAASTGRDNGQGPSEVRRITAELQAHEAEHGPLGGDTVSGAGSEQTGAPPATAPPAPPATAPPAPPATVPPAPPTQAAAVPQAAPPPPAGIVPPPPPMSEHGTPAGAAPPPPVFAPLPPPTAPGPVSEGESTINEA
jgi:hypothetical protein